MAQSEPRQDAQEWPGSMTDPDRGDFRNVLGAFPTGVVIISGASHAGPAGLSVNSFTSVSLEPRLIGFCASKRSESWPAIEPTGRFCVNILAEDQEDLARAFAKKCSDKFDGVLWRPARSGNPILDGVRAWIDCSIRERHEAGDHWWILGEVVTMAIERPAPPLIFCESRYRRFGDPLAGTSG